jgi:hypothetical protein
MDLVLVPIGGIEPIDKLPKVDMQQLIESILIELTHRID